MSAALGWRDVLSAPFHRLRRALAAPAVPGYRPGATLARVAREIDPAWHGMPHDAAGAVLQLAAGAAPRAAVLRERVERHFLMHIVNVELVLRVPAAQPAQGRIGLHHQGLLRRGALVHRLRGARDAQDGQRDDLAALAQRLCADAAVQAALQPLDQRRCEIVGVGDAWELRIEPFGGCDVVNRLPALRRHVRLGAAQVRALVQSAAALVAAIEAFHAERRHPQPPDAPPT